MDIVHILVHFATLMLYVLNVCSLLWKFCWAEVPDIPWPSFLEHFLLAIELYNITLLYGVVRLSVSLSLDVSSLVLFFTLFCVCYHESSTW